MDSRPLRKARGAFFTPPEITDFMANWAVRSKSDRVFEPSCGEAAFLLSAAARLDELGLPLIKTKSQLHGIEIHDTSAETAHNILSAAGTNATIQVGNFFDMARDQRFDVVIGNPPYVRYQQFAGSDRLKAAQAALAQGVRLTGLASSWAAFTVHAAQFLKPGGRLALVLPAELLSVNYAAQVRRFLLSRFERVRLVLFDELVFPNVLEEVVLLLAEGEKTDDSNPSKFEVFQARNLSDLKAIDASSLWNGFTPIDQSHKWTAALLSASAFEIYERFCSGASFCKLIDWGETYLGSVTGNNDYFTLTSAQAASRGLPEHELLPISPPGARHLRGLNFTSAAWKKLAKEGKRGFLFMPDRDKPSAAAKRYIAEGEAANVHLAYKCRMRSPWWRVPLVAKPDLLFTYMNHDRPRLTTNSAGVQLLNSLYGVSLHDGGRKLGRDLLPAACLNSLTLLGAEIVGRAYGGGLLKHEPKEADMLPVPSVAALRAVEAPLRSVVPQVASALRSPDTASATLLVDKVVLEDFLGLTSEEIHVLRRARDVLFQRRVTRGRGDRGAG